MQCKICDWEISLYHTQELTGERSMVKDGKRVLYQNLPFIQRLRHGTFFLKTELYKNLSDRHEIIVWVLVLLSLKHCIHVNYFSNI